MDARVTQCKQEEVSRLRARYRAGEISAREYVELALRLFEVPAEPGAEPGVETIRKYAGVLRALARA